MPSLREILDRAKREAEEDKKRWENLDSDLCQVCGARGSDRRTLFISCFYRLKEVSPKFIDLRGTEIGKGYALRICKGCRGSLLFDYLLPWITKKGRLIHGNLDEDGILSFSSKEEFMKFQREAKK